MNTADAETMAYDILRSHGLTARVVWVSDLWANGRALISTDRMHDELWLSVDLTNVRSEAEVRNTINHEAVHLITREHEHNAKFYETAREFNVTANEGSKSLVKALAMRARTR